jgi:hypothetical protein
MWQITRGRAAGGVIDSSLVADRMEQQDHREVIARTEWRERSVIPSDRSHAIVIPSDRSHAIVIPSERSESRDLHVTTGVPNDGSRMTRI